MTAQTRRQSAEIRAPRVPLLSAVAGDPLQRQTGVRAVEVDRTGTPEKLRARAAREVGSRARDRGAGAQAAGFQVLPVRPAVAAGHARRGRASLAGRCVPAVPALKPSCPRWRYRGRRAVSSLGFGLRLVAWHHPPRLRKRSAAARVLEISAEKASAKRLAALDAEIAGGARGGRAKPRARPSANPIGMEIPPQQRARKNSNANSPGCPPRLEKLHRRKLAKIDAAHERALEAAQVEAVERVRLTEASRAASQLPSSSPMSMPGSKNSQFRGRQNVLSCVELARRAGIRSSRALPRMDAGRLRHLDTARRGSAGPPHRPHRGGSRQTNRRTPLRSADRPAGRQERWKCPLRWRFPTRGRS